MNVSGASGPIGVFDSGVGGLSVLRHIRAALPRESLLYVADSAHAPYGEKSPDAIRTRAERLSDFLIVSGAKAIVIACNTATAAAAAHLRARHALPIIAMEPAVKPAVAVTQSGVIGVLATTGTLQSAQFAALLEGFGQGVRVVTQAGHGLVEAVEQGALDTADTRALIESHLAPILAAGADTLVLGCTHYPFLRDTITQLAGPRLTLIDTGEAVARQLARRLQESALARGDQGEVFERFWTSGALARARGVMPKLWGAPIEVRALPESD